MQQADIAVISAMEIAQEYTASQLAERVGINAKKVRAILLRCLRGG